MILLEGGVTVSNNFTKRSQNGFKIGTRDKLATHLRQENFISIEMVIYTFFLQSLIFPYNSLYTQTVAHTTYFELGQPMFTHELWRIRNRTSERSERVRFLIQNNECVNTVQSTFHVVLCLLYTDTEIEHAP